VYAIYEDFDEPGYTNPLPIADGNGLDEDTQEICSNGEDC